ncbi:MAG: hypothetical protein JSW63_05870 [Ignavibacterium sp.]|nr:MAG: hypothetical protein JSW63_05870 [Ignavibacterium sp.]
MVYDPDGNHIYGVSNYYNYPTSSYSSNIYVSSDNGNPFSWTNVLTKNLPIRFTHDESNQVKFIIRLKEIFTNPQTMEIHLLITDSLIDILMDYIKSQVPIFFMRLPH